MSTAAILTDNLSKRFGSIRALDHLSLEVPRGQVFGFLGPNGSGKTTTIRLLLGLLEPSEGRASVLGLDVQKQADQIRSRTGALLEYSGLYERLSAEDNLDFYGRVWRLPAAQRRARSKELLVSLGLWERRREVVSTWSRGMRQKLAVARTLLHRPALVFLDEPTAGLDALAAAALRDDLASLVDQEGLTVFLTTHNLTEAERLCQQVAIIRQGRLLAVGKPSELRSSSDSPRVQVVGSGFTPAVVATLAARPEVARAALDGAGLALELRPGASVAPLVRLLVGQGVDIEEVRKVKPTLEEAFINLMNETLMNEER